MAAFWTIFRDTGPRWLRLGYAGRILQSIGMHADHISQMAIDATDRSLPGSFIPDGLALTGQSRMIRRGPGEDSRHYSDRMQAYLTDHARRGNPYEMLAQVHAYFENYLTFQIELVYPSGKRFTKDAAGAVTVDTIVWELDDLLDQWARWAMFFRVDDDLPVTDDELRELLNDWNAAHMLGTAYIMHSNSHFWGEPGLTWDDGSLWAETSPRTVGGIGLIGTAPVVAAPDTTIDEDLMTIFQASDSAALAAPGDSPIDGAVASDVVGGNTVLPSYLFAGGASKSVSRSVFVPAAAVSVAVKLHVYRPDTDSGENIQFFCAGRSGTLVWSGVTAGPTVADTTIPETDTVEYLLANTTLAALGMVAGRNCTLDINRQATGSSVNIGVTAIEFVWSA